MSNNSHAARHKRLDAALNELVADFIEHSGVPAHLATMNQLLIWSKSEMQEINHPNTAGRHEAKL